MQVEKLRADRHAWRDEHAGGAANDRALDPALVDESGVPGVELDDGRRAGVLCGRRSRQKESKSEAESGNDQRAAHVGLHMEMRKRCPGRLMKRQRPGLKTRPPSQ